MPPEVQNKLKIRTANRARTIAVGALILFASSFTPSLYGQQPPARQSQSAVVDDSITAERIAAEITAIEGISDLGIETKKELLDRLNKAAKWLQDEADAVRRRLEIEAQLVAIPDQLRAVSDELAKPSPPTQVDFPANPTVPQLEAQLAELRHQVELDEADAKAKDEEVESRVKHTSRKSARKL